MKESKKRSLYSYLKLDEDYPAAITWMQGEDKMAKLFTSVEKAKAYLHWHRNLIIEHGAKIVEDYIPRPTYGIVIDYDTGKPMIDTATGLPNVCKALEKLNGVKVKGKNLTGAKKRLIEARRSIAAELEDIENAVIDSSLTLAGVKGLQDRVARLDALLRNKALELRAIVNEVEGH